MRNQTTRLRRGLVAGGAVVAAVATVSAGTPASAQAPAMYSCTGATFDGNVVAVVAATVPESVPAGSTIPLTDMAAWLSDGNPGVLEYADDGIVGLGLTLQPGGVGVGMGESAIDADVTAHEFDPQTATIPASGTPGTTVDIFASTLTVSVNATTPETLECTPEDGVGVHVASVMLTEEGTPPGPHVVPGVIPATPISANPRYAG